MTYKLEVGKKYLNRDGNVWTVIHKIDNLDFGYVALLNEGTEHEARAFFSIQGRRFGFDKSYDSEPSMKTLLKEYHEPRTWQEVMGDLMQWVRYSQTCLPQEALSMLHEAQQLLNKEKG